MADNQTDDLADDTTSSPQVERDVEAERVPEHEQAPEYEHASEPAPAAEPTRETHHEPATASSAEVDAERERLVAERAARREARLAALAPAPEPEPQHVAATPQYATPVAAGTGATAASAVPVRTETVTVTQRSTDRFAGSLGLFLLRLVTAVIIGIHGMQHLLNLPAATQMIQETVLPAPSILAVVLGAAEVAIAIALVFGLLTRLAGLGLALVAGGALAFVRWGSWSPFKPGESGFSGELELLLVAAACCSCSWGPVAGRSTTASAPVGRRRGTPERPQFHAPGHALLEYGPGPSGPRHLSSVGRATHS